MLGEDACSSLGGAPSTRPTSKQPNHCTMPHFSLVFLLSWTHSSSCWNWRGKRLPLFPLDLALSRNGYTPVVSADARHVFSGVSPVLRAPHPVSIPRPRQEPRAPHRAGESRKASAGLGSVWKLAGLMRATHTPSCCRSDVAASKENLQSCFLEKMMNVVFFLSFFSPLSEYENCISQVT